MGLVIAGKESPNPWLLRKGGEGAMSLVVVSEEDIRRFDGGGATAGEAESRCWLEKLRFLSAREKEGWDT